VNQPIGLVTGLDGALWFTSVSQPIVGRVTTSGDVRLFALVDAAGPIARSTWYGGPLTVAADGALWIPGRLGVTRVVP